MAGNECAVHEHHVDDDHEALHEVAKEVPPLVVGPKMKEGVYGDQSVAQVKPDRGWQVSDLARGVDIDEFVHQLRRSWCVR